MGITIKDVAEAAGVSKTTVSFYLNGKFEYMSIETKEKIKKIIKELNYKPSSTAQGLKSKKSKLIGMIVSDITNPFTSLLVKGVNDKCIEEGYQLIVVNTNNITDKQEEYINSLIQRQVDGLIINSLGDNIDMLEKIKEKGMKVVLADKSLEKNIFDSVTTNNEEMTIKAINMLFEEGFQEIAFFTQQIKANTAKLNRFNGFKKVIQNHNKKPENYLYQFTDQEDMDKKVSEFYASNKDKKKVVFAANGITMLQFVQSTLKLKLSIPEDIALCGFDDLGWNSIVGKGITTISQPAYEVGNKSAEILIDRITERLITKETINLILKAQLIKRGSTDI